MRISGTVKFFNSAKGFGSFPRTAQRDVFVHASHSGRGIRSLNEGDKVTLHAEDDRKGRASKPDKSNGLKRMTPKRGV